MTAAFPLQISTKCRCTVLYFRQEMQHFVRVMQGYMANQIIQVTWKELQEALDHDVHSVDDLKRVHGEYLHKALFR